MKKRTIILPGVGVAAIIALFFSCNKLNELHNLLPDCDVSAYTLTRFQQNPYGGVTPVLFTKTYDKFGKMATEIDFTFWDALLIPQFHAHQLLITSNGQKLFLLDKNNPHDTVVTIVLNNEGRPESCESNNELNDSYGDAHGELEKYVYKNNRVIAIKSTDPAAGEGEGLITSHTDSIHYDSHGNVSSFGDNSYQYDYTKKAKQQFYCDDLMEFDDGFYLLQYLGFFPEVTSPVNIRTHVNAVVFTGDITSHQFDGEGKLTGYGFAGGVTIAWHCQ